MAKKRIVFNNMMELAPLSPMEDKEAFKAKEKISISDILEKVVDEVLSSPLQELPHHVSGFDIETFFENLVEIGENIKDQSICNIFKSQSARIKFHMEERLYGIDIKEKERPFLRKFLKTQTEDSLKLDTFQNVNSAPLERLLSNLLRQVKVSISHPEKNKLNEFLLSDIRTWLDEYEHIQEEDDRIEGTYPICKLISDADWIILIVVSPIDHNFVDSKVDKLQRLPPIHLMIFKNTVEIENEQIENAEALLKSSCGYIAHLLASKSINSSLKDIAEDASVISRYWYTQAIDEIFDKGYYRQTGVVFAQKIVETLLCVQVEGNNGLEVFPFNRAVIFSNEAEAFYFHEAGYKSRRPQDDGKYVTSMEQLNNLADDQNGENPDDADLFAHFNLDRKVIDTIKTVEVEYDSSVFRLSYDHQYKEDLINTVINETFEELRKDAERGKSDIFFADQLKLNRISELLNYFITVKIKRAIQNKIIPNEELSKEETRSLADTQLFLSRFYDDELCVLSDFGEKLLDSSDPQKTPLSILHDFYVAWHIRSSHKDFKLRPNKNVRGKLPIDERISEKWITEESKRNIPEYTIYNKWVSEQEQKIMFVSYQPNDKHRKENGFNILLIADDDVIKNNYDMQTEIDNLGQAIRMILNRVKSEEKLENTVRLRNKNLFDSMLPAVAHRAKNYMSNSEQASQFDKMIGSIQSILGASSFDLESDDLPTYPKKDPYMLMAITINDNNELEKRNTNELLKIYKEEIFSYQKRKIPELLGIDKDKSEVNEVIKDIEEKTRISKSISFLPEFYFPYNNNLFREVMKNIVTNAIEFSTVHAEKLDKCQLHFDVDMDYDRNAEEKGNGGKLVFKIVNSAIINQNQIERLNRSIVEINSNSTESKRDLKDPHKANSTGIGIEVAKNLMEKLFDGKATLEYTTLPDNMLECRLSIPVRIKSVEKRKLRKIEKESIIPENNRDILYIEDDFVLAKGTISALAKTIGKDRVQHYDNMLDAIDFMNKKAPELLLLDLNVFEEEKGGNAQRGNSLKVLEEFMRHKYSAPILFLTSSEINEQLQFFDEANENTSENYKYIHAKEVEKLEPFTVYSLPNVKQLDRDSVNEQLVLDLISNYYKDLENHKKSLKNTFDEKSKIEDSHKKNKIKFEELCPNYEKIDEIVKAHVEKNGIEEMLLFSKKITNSNQLVDAISFWINQPKIPHYFSERMRKRGYTKKLQENDSVRMVALYLMIPEKLNGKLPNPLRYLLLSNNICLGTYNPNEFNGTTWMQLKHGRKGMVSSYRHDMKNKAMDHRSRNEILSIINEIENRLLPESTVLNEIKDDLRSGEIIAWWDDNKNKLQQAAMRKEIRTVIDQLKTITDKEAITAFHSFNQLNTLLN